MYVFKLLHLLPLFNEIKLNLIDAGVHPADLVRIDVVLREEYHPLGRRITGLADLDCKFPYFPIERILIFFHSELKVCE
jgi:hypothetical protein